MHEVIEGYADRSGGTWQVGRGEASDFRFKFVDEQDRKTRTSWPHKTRAKSMPQSPKAPTYPQLNVRGWMRSYCGGLMPGDASKRTCPTGPRLCGGSWSRR